MKPPHLKLSDLVRQLAIGVPGNFHHLAILALAMLDSALETHPDVLFHDVGVVAGLPHTVLREQVQEFDLLLELVKSLEGGEEGALAGGVDWKMEHEDPE